MWKLADFALSTMVSSKSLGVTTSIGGTEGYLAPEFLIEIGNPSYDNKVDIWALGCILYEFVVGAQPFGTNYLTLQYKFTGLLPEITLDEYFSEAEKERVKSIVRRMLAIDPSARPPAKELVEEFSTNRQCTMTEPPQNVQIHQVFQALYIHSSDLGPRAPARRIDELDTSYEEHVLESQQNPQISQEPAISPEQTEVLEEVVTALESRQSNRREPCY